VTIAHYQQRFHLQDAHFTLIDHEDAMVATVFKITKPSGEELILKICSRPGDYLREVYFLTHLLGKVPIPRLIQLSPPDAILMECLPGHLIQPDNLTAPLCHTVGALLAHLHLDRAPGYGDLTKPAELSSDPRLPFAEKFREEFEECQDHLPKTLLTKIQRYYDEHIDLLLKTDGPCLIHRDFRPGNVFTQHGRIQGIIDWSSARGGFAEEDFVSLEQWGEEQAFLAGYATIRKVPHFQRVLPLLRLSKATGAIGFTVKQGTWQNKGAKLYQFHRHYLDDLLI